MASGIPRPATAASGGAPRDFAAQSCVCFPQARRGPFAAPRPRVRVPPLAPHMSSALALTPPLAARPAASATRCRRASGRLRGPGRAPGGRRAARRRRRRASSRPSATRSATARPSRPRRSARWSRTWSTPASATPSSASSTAASRSASATTGRGSTIRSAPSSPASPRPAPRPASWCAASAAGSRSPRRLMDAGGGRLELADNLGGGAVVTLSAPAPDVAGARARLLARPPASSSPCSWRSASGRPRATRRGAGTLPRRVRTGAGHPAAPRARRPGARRRTPAHRRRRGPRRHPLLNPPPHPRPALSAPLEPRPCQRSPPHPSSATPSGRRSASGCAPRSTARPTSSPSRAHGPCP